MKKDNIEQKIYEEFEKRKPDLFQNIMDQCPKMKDEFPKETFFSRVKTLFSQKRLSYSFASLVAIIAVGVLLIGQLEPTPIEAYSIIAIDVNPSVELELDEDGKVINVILNNEDAEIILGDMDLIGVDYNVAVNALIGSMVSKGYISDLANSILLSVSSGSITKETELKEKLSDTIASVLTLNHINGSVITQGLGNDEEVIELSELLEISKAKADLILDIIEQDPRMIAEELATLSINELNLLLESKNINLPDVAKSGNASMKNIISEEQAYQIALTTLGLDNIDVIEYDIELEESVGGLLYEIEIETALDNYDVQIKARNGEVFVHDEDDSNDDDIPLEEALSEQEIKNIIGIELGISSELIIFDEFEEKIDNNIVYYDIEFEYDDNDYELEVDALTGEIYRNSMDSEGFSHNNDDNDNGKGHNGNQGDDDD